MKIKGQTAMEYLMTYGWAILIIIVVVAALYAMGVFSMKGGVACGPCFSYFAFIDYDNTNDDVYIRNGARTINTLASDVGTVNADPDCTLSTNNCDPGTDINITSIGAAAGSVKITLTYIDATSNVQHTDSATIRGK